VVGDHLGQMGVFTGELPEDARPDLRDLLPGLERNVDLLERESVDVAVDDRDAVSGHDQRKPIVAKASEHRVVVA